jgi:predicted glycoside hydrolase/deacetylase ChbG (UPF0249 family)
MPKSNNLCECLEMLEPYKKNIMVTVHLNLIEGKSVCSPQEIPLLTDGDGMLCCSFAKLLIRSYLPTKNAYLCQLKKELSAQIHAVSDCSKTLRIDGHAHYHMIPVVFDALMEIIAEENLNVSYIRIPREHLSLYFLHMFQLKGISPINFLKVFILNILAIRNMKKHNVYMKKLEQRVFLGVFLSGAMYQENVECLLPGAIKLAQKRKCGLEILAHPGGIYEEEDIARLTNRDDIAFLNNPARNKEATMLMNI